MIVQFSINPMDNDHISGDINQVKAYLDEVGMDYCMGPIGTSIQGSWDTVMPVIKRCHELITEGHLRVLTNITIDDHKDDEYTLRDAIKAGLDPDAVHAPKLREA